MNIQENCKCGKTHKFSSQIIVGEGAIRELPGILQKHSAKKVYLIADKHTYEAAGKAVKALLDEEAIETVTCIFRDDALEPNEHSVGRAIMYYEANVPM